MGMTFWHNAHDEKNALDKKVGTIEN